MDSPSETRMGEVCDDRVQHSSFLSTGASTGPPDPAKLAVLLAWLDSLPDSYDLDSAFLASNKSLDAGDLKRKRCAAASSLTPPATTIAPRSCGGSVSQEMESKIPATKRRQVETPTAGGSGQDVVPGTTASHADPDATPRGPQHTSSTAPLPALLSPEALTWTASSSSFAGVSSRVKGRSISPRKQLGALSLRDDGIEVRAFLKPSSPLDPQPSPALYSLVRKMDQVSHGIGIISALRRAEIQAMAPTWHVAPHMFDSGTNRDAYGQTPSVQEVEEVVYWAHELSRTGAEQAAWNSAVHHQLLKLSICKNGRPPSDLVGFSQCTSAALVPEYCISDTPTAKVDFCIHIDPRFDSVLDNVSAGARIQALCRVLPELMINAADHETLWERPVAISIKSAYSGGVDDARLQTGLWHAAQWRMLDALLELQTAAIPNSSIENAGAVPSPASPPSLCDFLPAVVINGHDWSFMATTKHGQKTILWHEVRFGSTRDAEGVYKIVYGLQILSNWARTEFWPWYRRVILYLD